MLFSVASNAQTVQELVKFADEQYELGNASIASKEYNRAFFFGYPEQGVLSLKIANCYLQMNQYDLASVFFDKAYRLSKTDSLKNEAVLGNAFCMLIQEKYVLSLSELYNWEEGTTERQEIHYHFLKGIAHFQLQDDSTAQVEFIAALSLQGDSVQMADVLGNEFENIYDYRKRYKPQLAYVMSGIIPGSGQFYSGSIKDGINSMLLIGGLFIVAMQVVKYYSFLDASIALFPWVQRYYLGGMDKSKDLAFKKLEEKRYESYVEILEITTPNDF